MGPWDLGGLKEGVEKSLWLQVPIQIISPCRSTPLAVRLAALSPTVIGRNQNFVRVMVVTS